MCSDHYRCALFLSRRYGILVFMTTITLNKIRSLVRESVREEFSAKMMEIRASLLPLVSQSEAANIKKLYKKPSERIARTIHAAL